MKKPFNVVLRNILLVFFLLEVSIFVIAMAYVMYDACEWNAKQQRAAGREPSCELWK